MAKTVLLNNIETALRSARDFNHLLEEEVKQYHIDPGSITLFKQHLKTLETALLAFDKHIKKWDSPSLKSKFKNLAKDQAKLDKARWEAKVQFKEFEKAHASLKQSLVRAQKLAQYFELTKETTAQDRFLRRVGNERPQNGQL